MIQKQKLYNNQNFSEFLKIFTRRWDGRKFETTNFERFTDV